MVSVVNKFSSIYLPSITNFPFYIFSSDLYGEMNCDRATLHVFTEKVIQGLTGSLPTIENSLLVALKYDGTAIMLNAQESSALEEVGNLNMDNSPYHCWKLFSDLAVAGNFLQRLQSADMSIHLPPDPSKKLAERWECESLSFSVLWYLLCSQLFFFFNVRVALLGELSDNVTIVNDFILTASSFRIPSSKPVPSFLVVFFRNYKSNLLIASDKDSTGNAIRILNDVKFAFGWKVFSTIETAKAFELRLRKLDNTVDLPESPTAPTGSPLAGTSPFGLAGGPPQTLFSKEEESRNCVAIGNMMVREDNIAESLAAEAGADANEAEARASAGFSPSRNTIAPSAMSNNASASRFGGSGKFQSSAISAEASGSEVIDMSKMKFNFNKNGVRSFDSQGVKLLVSKLIPHKFYNEKYAFVLMERVHRALWYFEARFLQELFSPFIQVELVSKGKAVPLFLETLDDIATCKQNDPHEYRTSKSGWTINKPFFLVRVPNGMASVDKYVSDAFNTIASNFKENSSIGAMYADWMRANKENLYNSETGITSRKKKITHEQFAQFLHTKLVQAFSNKTIEYNVPLDKMITYGHIKEFLIDQCGYNHWSELPLDLKSAILARSYQAYPDWDQTEVKPYGQSD